jgi:deoxyribose-phosphate aldolase
VLTVIDQASGLSAYSAQGRSIQIGSVDKVALEARAKAFQTRSIKTTSKRAALELSIRCIDLTTLEGFDSPGKVRAMCQKAIRPDPHNPDLPRVAAVCVYPELVDVAAETLAGSGVKVASVAGAFPSGLSSMDVRAADIRDAVQRGADEIDIVLNRSAFMTGDYATVFNDVAASKEACGDAHLKVILEVGELGNYDRVRRASMISMLAGADFIKTSTGKIPKASTLPVSLCMAECIRDFHDQTGEVIGLKSAGGIRTAKQAWHYLVMVQETLGPAWLHPDRFRIGASSLLNDVLLQLNKLNDGRYSSPNYLTLD